MTSRSALAVIASVVACTGGLPCTTPRIPQGRGVAAGKIHLLTASPGGEALAWLQDCGPGSGAVDELCDVGVFAEGGVERVGRRARLANGLAWSPDGRLGVLVDFARGEGELRVWSPKDGVEHVADGVTSFSFAPGLLAYVSRGVGYLSGDGIAHAIRVAGALESILASPSGRVGEPAALALGSGGTLFAVMSDGAATPLGREVSEYGFSTSTKFAVVVTSRERGRELRVVPLGGGRARTLARGVTSRKLARAEDLVAFVTEGEEASRLRVANLESGEIRALGSSPVRYEWAARAPVLAWIGGPSRALGVVRPGEDLLSFGEEATAFDLSDDGSWIAYTIALSEPDAYNQLFLVRVAGEAVPIDISYNVPSFAFTPDASKLVLASHCQREVALLGKAGTDLGFCTVWAVHAPFSPASSKLRFGSSPGAEGSKIHGLAQWFKVDNRTGRVLTAEKQNRLIASWRMRDSYIDSDVDLDHVIFLPPDSNRVAYAVSDPQRAGVYVADVPDLPGAKGASP